MFIYNVTTHVEPSIEGKWLDWMKNDHLPKMLATGHFFEVRLFRVATQDDRGGVSYAAQYRCNSRSDFDQYVLTDARRLREETQKHFGEKVLSFRTELEEIIHLT